MAQEGLSFRMSIVTPERPILDAQANSVVLPAHDGQIGILRNRAPLLCKLGIGVLRGEGPQGAIGVAIDGGFAECAANVVTVLTQQAWKPDEINADEAREELAAAEAMAITDEQSVQTRRDAIDRAKVKLRLVAG